MKILFIDTCHPFLINSLKADGHEVIEGYNFSYEEVCKVLKDVQGVVVRSRFKLDKTLLDNAEKLVFIARAGAGMESIDVEYARSRNIVCLNSPEGNKDAVGEHAIGMLLSLMNNLNRSDRQIRGGEWVREANRGHELQGKTVGIIGFGNMGSSFAEKLKGFNCRILAYDKYRKNFGNEFINESTLEQIFDLSDIVSIHVPLTEETEFFINDSYIKKFKKSIYLINTARGKCLKTDDLILNLKSGKVLGACLDVIEYEDLSFEKFSANSLMDNPSWQYLIQSERVILSPHIAGWTFESLEKIAKILYEKIGVIIKESNS